MTLKDIVVVRPYSHMESWLCESPALNTLGILVSGHGGSPEEAVSEFCVALSGCLAVELEDGNLQEEI